MRNGIHGTQNSDNGPTRICDYKSNNPVGRVFGQATSNYFPRINTLEQPIHHLLVNGLDVMPFFWRFHAAGNITSFVAAIARAEISDGNQR